jgi:hypothetical protein
MVKILLANRSPIISELILLGLDELDVEITEIDNIDGVAKDAYDVLVVDDSYGDSRDMQLLIDEIDTHKKILLSSTQSDTLQRVTKTILKPFLPKDIKVAIEESTNILDLDEIQSIREILDTGLPTTTKNKKIKKQKALSKPLIEELLQMKSKKIRKLLAGAEINISIKFPKGEKK